MVAAMRTPGARPVAAGALGLGSAAPAPDADDYRVSRSGKNARSRIFTTGADAAGAARWPPGAAGADRERPARPVPSPRC